MSVLITYLAHDVVPQEGGSVVPVALLRARPRVAAAVRDEDVVGVGEVGVLVRVGREDAADRLLRGPPVRRHPVVLAGGAAGAALLVVADPAALQEDDPALALVVPPHVVAGHAAVVARDVVVVEELALQPVGRLVAPVVQRLRQLPERVRREALGGGAGVRRGRGRGRVRRSRRGGGRVARGEEEAEGAEEADGD